MFFPHVFFMVTFSQLRSIQVGRVSGSVAGSCGGLFMGLPLRRPGTPEDSSDLWSPLPGLEQSCTEAPETWWCLPLATPWSQEPG